MGTTELPIGYYLLKQEGKKYWIDQDKDGSLSRLQLAS
jgi:hypothetical protein